MISFKSYLLSRKYKDSTIGEHLLNSSRFLAWLIEEHNMDAQEVRYSDLLAYIQYEKARGLQITTIQLRLNSIYQYYEYLKEQGEVEKNPGATIELKGEVHKVIINPLNRAELDYLYQQYSQLQKEDHRQAQVNAVHARNTVILGLIVFQGVHSGEIQQMEVSHINLVIGTVYIPSTSQGSSRSLELSPKQAIAMHQYLTVIRVGLKPKGDELIPGSIRNIIQHLMEEIKGINPVITNALHLRGSVILSWLKLHSKRQVQYMAGHKYISSTEKYASQEVDDLQEAMAKYHPFG